jgi:hypothetical protein
MLPTLSDLVSLICLEVDLAKLERKDKINCHVFIREHMPEAVQQAIANAMASENSDYATEIVEVVYQERQGITSAHLLTFMRIYRAELKFCSKTAREKVLSYWQAILAEKPLAYPSFLEESYNVFKDRSTSEKLRAIGNGIDSAIQRKLGNMFSYEELSNYLSTAIFSTHLWHKLSTNSMQERLMEIDTFTLRAEFLEINSLMCEIRGDNYLPLIPFSRMGEGYQEEVSQLQRMNPLEVGDMHDQLLIKMVASLDNFELKAIYKEEVLLYVSEITEKILINWWALSRIPHAFPTMLEYLLQDQARIQTAEEKVEFIAQSLERIKDEYIGSICNYKHLYRTLDKLWTESEVWYERSAGKEECQLRRITGNNELVSKQVQTHYGQNMASLFASSELHHRHLTKEMVAENQMILAPHPQPRWQMMLPTSTYLQLKPYLDAGEYPEDPVLKQQFRELMERFVYSLDSDTNRLRNRDYWASWSHCLADKSKMVVDYIDSWIGPGSAKADAVSAFFESTMFSVICINLGIRFGARFSAPIIKTSDSFLKRLLEPKPVVILNDYYKKMLRRNSSTYEGIREKIAILSSKLREMTNDQSLLYVMQGGMIEAIESKLKESVNDPNNLQHYMYWDTNARKSLADLGMRTGYTQAAGTAWEMKQIAEQIARLLPKMEVCLRNILEAQEYLTLPWRSKEGQFNRAISRMNKWLERSEAFFSIPNRVIDNPTYAKLTKLLTILSYVSLGVKITRYASSKLGYKDPFYGLINMTNRAAINWQLSKEGIDSNGNFTILEFSDIELFRSIAIETMLEMLELGELYPDIILPRDITNLIKDFYTRDPIIEEIEEVIVR